MRIHTTFMSTSSLIDKISENWTSASGRGCLTHEYQLGLVGSPLGARLFIYKGSLITWEIIRTFIISRRRLIISMLHFLHFYLF